MTFIVRRPPRTLLENAVKSFVYLVVVWFGLALLFRRYLIAHLLSGGPFRTPIGHRPIGWSGTTGAVAVSAVGPSEMSARRVAGGQ
ncbi:hypothetical protein BS297_24620 [Rhodococcus erythropolis]|uniref:Uncharacterized protein n=1 Tax=Rhodococcus erythropolis TaxID=1833 RepID=A0A0C2VHE0_RHOER|nr:hypothetical protein BS297_24620 [Rhodococcus erythropolis]KIM14278.1 hypothetical protein QV65_33340 [Rhodococcus erythropolis]